MFRYLIFDLDETLYPRAAGLMQEIGRRIMRYLTERMGFAPDEAVVKRDHYFYKYGTSLRGLMLEETVDAEDYLSFVHDIALADYIRPAPALAAMLRQIPLTKVVFTNAMEEHARRVLGVLGIADQFSAIADIRATGFVNKPDPQAYRNVLTLIGARAGECILVEDTPRNLLPAKALGMTTILVDHQECDDVDYCVDDVLKVGEVVAQILNARANVGVGPVNDARLNAEGGGDDGHHAQA